VDEGSDVLEPGMVDPSEPISSNRVAMHLSPADYDSYVMNVSMQCGKGDQEVSATIYTREYESLAKSILQKGVFKSVSGDDKDVYDCGSAGIKSVNVKSIQGCLNKGKMHADMGIEYVCNQQARIRSVSVDFVGQVSGNC
jgi:hypothetical protein